MDDPEFAGFFSHVGHFFSNAAKVAGREIGHSASSIQKAGGKIGDAVAKIPVVGAPIHTVLDATYHAVSMPANVAVAAATGKRVDKALLSELKKQVQDVHELAPYAQTVLSVVPGVGSGASAALGAGLALAEGQPIDKALLSAVVAAVPGGPVAHSAANIAMHAVDAAARGEKFDTHSVLGPALDALPIPKAARDALAQGVQMTTAIAQGKNVSAAAADAALHTGLRYLPDSAKKAFQTTLGASLGAVTQQIRATHLPDIHNKLVESGIQLSKTLPTVAEARKLVGPGTRGFDLGHGLLAQKAQLFDIMHMRHSLTNPADQKGFDMALANKIGLVAHPPHPTLSPAAQAGRTITHGMQGMMKPENKMDIMKSISKNPSAAVGAKVALQQISTERKPWPVRLMTAIRNLFQHSSHAV